MQSIDQPIDLHELLCEIQSYLAAVAVFRAVGGDVGGNRRREWSKRSVDRVSAR